MRFFELKGEIEYDLADQKQRDALAEILRRGTEALCQTLKMVTEKDRTVAIGGFSETAKAFHDWRSARRYESKLSDFTTLTLDENCYADHPGFVYPTDVVIELQVDKTDSFHVSVMNVEVEGSLEDCEVVLWNELVRHEIEPGFSWGQVSSHRIALGGEKHETA